MAASTKMEHRLQAGLQAIVVALLMWTVDTVNGLDKSVAVIQTDVAHVKEDVQDIKAIEGRVRNLEINKG